MYCSGMHRHTSYHWHHPRWQWCPTLKAGLAKVAKRLTDAVAYCEIKVKRFSIYSKCGIARMTGHDVPGTTVDTSALAFDAAKEHLST